MPEHIGMVGEGLNFSRPLLRLYLRSGDAAQDSVYHHALLTDFYRKDEFLILLGRSFSNTRPYCYDD